MAVENHPIWLYYIEQSGIVDAFRMLLKSYQTSTDFLNLRAGQDDDLMDLLEETIELVYPFSNSAVQIDPEKRRLNMYYRRFGLKIKGKDEFPLANSFNEQFEKNFKEIMVNIFQGIYDKNNQSVKVADPGRLAELLNSLRADLRDYNRNNVHQMTDEWVIAFERLIALLQNDELMNALNIRSGGLNERLLRLGQMVGVPASAVFESHLLLAERMQTFLRRVENLPHEWTTEEARQLYMPNDEEAFFRELATAWSRIDPETDFSKMALAVRTG